MNTEKYTVPRLRVLAVSACIAIFAFTTTPIAQAREGNTMDLRGILGSIFNSGAIKEAKKKWGKLDPDLKGCLKNSHGIHADQMVKKGISPTDRRVAPYIKHCQERLAKVRRKAEEAERLQQARLKAQRKAEDTARRKREARQKAQKKAKETRRRDLAAKYGSEMAKIIIRGRVVMGMTREQVAAARGKTRPQGRNPAGRRALVLRIGTNRIHKWQSDVYR